MTRGEWLLSVRLATWMDRISERLLCDDCRSLGYARMTRGEWLLSVGWRLGSTEHRSGYSATTADPSASLGNDKGRVATFREVGDLDGQNIGAATLRRLQIPRLRSG